MPAYNEEANIRTVVEQWHPVVEQIGEDSRVVIVDDGSKDATYRVLEELRATYPQLIGLTKKNSGHGSTCLYAYRYAIEQGADYVFRPIPTDRPIRQSLRHFGNNGPIMIF